METTLHLKNRHNVSLIMYHFVCPTKYRRIVLDDKVDNYFKVICLDIELRYDIKFLEIWLDWDHVHFLIQWVPVLSPTKIITIVKSILARKIFLTFPDVKKKLWWWNFFSSWFYVNTVGQYWNEEFIRKYVQNQWKEKEYKQIYKWYTDKNQLTLL